MLRRSKIYVGRDSREVFPYRYQNMSKVYYRPIIVHVRTVIALMVFSALIRKPTLAALPVIQMVSD